MSRSKPWLTTTLALLALSAPSACAGDASSLGGLLSPSMQAGAEVAQTAAGVAKKGLDIAHKAYVEFGYQMDFNVKYEPQDAVDGIHLRHDANDPKSKRITFEAKVEFKKDLESKLPAAGARKLAGFAIPPKGPAKDVRVRWYISPNLLEYTEIRAGEFDGMLPTWSSYTKADGVATGRLYLLRENPPLGGVKKVVEGTVRAKAMVQTAQGAPLDAITLGAALTDEAISVNEVTKTVRIERHEPTEWEADVTIYRSATANWDINRPGKSGDTSTRTTRFYGNELWSSETKLTNIRLNTQGLGDGQYGCAMTGEGTTHTVTQSFLFGNEGKGGPRKVFDYLDTEGKGTGEEGGRASVTIEVDDRTDPATYSVVVRAPGSGTRAMSFPLFSGRGSSTHKWTDSDGQHSKTDNRDFMAQSFVTRAMTLPTELVPRAQWPTFDPDATQLSDSITWEENSPARQDTPKVHLVTQVAWTLRRVMPK